MPRIDTLNSKFEIINSKQISISQTTNSKQYDLEERTFKFSKSIIIYVNNLPKSTSNIETGRQLMRSAGSVGANYIEANEALSRKDFIMRIKISKKEAKESHYWLRLTEPREEYSRDRCSLVQESVELMKILGAILEKTQ